MLFSNIVGLAVAALASIAQASPFDVTHLQRRASSSDRLVFCHFMVSSIDPVSILFMPFPFSLW